MTERAHQSTLELGDNEIDLIRTALQLLLRSEDEPAEIDHIQALLDRLPAGTSQVTDQAPPTTPWW